MASVITIAGEQLFAAKAQANEQLDIDTFIFANVQGQDPTAPINREEGIPTAHIVYQQNVQQVGRINDNVVVYSTVLESITGPFEFNWVGLYSSVNQKLVAINHVPTVTKTATEPGAAGNTLNRNFGIEYSGIADLTGITVDAGTWQLDFTARLYGMDKLTRNLAKDMNGKDSFIDDGFKVVSRNDINTFEIMTGVGYISGLRVELDHAIYLTASEYPKYVYAEAYFEGDATSTWAPRVICYISDVEKDDFIDEQGKEHYLTPIALIASNNDVEDLRVSFTLQQDSYTRGFNTVAEAKNDKFLKVGQKISIKERDDAEFYIVKSSAANEISVISHEIRDIQFEIIEKTTMTLENYGATTNDTGDNSQIWSIINASPIVSEIKTKRDAIYRNTNDVNITRNFSISGSGDINSVGCSFTISGGLVDIGNIVTAAEEGQIEIVLSDTSMVKAGDILILHNQIQSSFSDHRSYYTDGEFVKVLKKTGNIVKLETCLLTGYEGVSTDKVFLMNHVTCNINEVSFYSSGLYSFQCKFNYNSLVNPKKVISKGVGTSAALVFNKCFNCEANPKEINKSYEDNASFGTDYGILYANSQSIRVNAGNIFGGRHAVAHGGDSSDGAVPCRDIITNGSVLKNQIESGTHTADIHGNSVNCYFDNCKIYGWTGIGGKDCGVRGGEVIPVDGQLQRNFQWVEVVGGRIEFSGIKTSLATNSSAQLYGANSSITMQKVSGDVEYVITDIDLYIPESNSAIFLGAIGNYADGAKVSWDVKINNIKVRGNLSSLKRITTLDSNNNAGFLIQPKSLTSYVLDNIDMDISGLEFWTVNGGGMIAPGTRVTMPKIERAANVSIAPGNSSSTTGLSVTFPSYIAKPNIVTMCAGQSSTAGVYVSAQCTESTVTSASVYLKTMSPTEVVSAKVDQRISARIGFDNFEWV